MSLFQIFLEQFWSSICTGIIIFTGLLYLIFYVKTKQESQVYYAGFLIGIGTFFIMAQLANLRPIWVSTIFYSIQFLALFCYLKFLQRFLKTKLVAPQWNKVMKYFSQFFLLLAGLFLILALFNQWLSRLNMLLAPVFTVFALLSYAVFAKIKGAHVKFIIIGSALFILLANASLWIGFAYIEEWHSLTQLKPMVLMQVGVVVEIVLTCLAFATQYIAFYNDFKLARLELDEKSKEKASLKMVALQSQMDPHFLYNSLNSINNFVLKNDAEKASDYITKFSRLIREILNNSSQITIPLSKELGMLSLYVKLEQMRMQHSFDYIVELDQSINPDQIEVPPLFLQPFVENAIWHGIAHQPYETFIKLSIKGEEEHVCIELEDNGIGINQTMQNKSYLDIEKKSFGVKATEDRIKLLHKNAKVYLIIEDLSDKQRQGTKVTIKFPKKRLTVY